MAAVVERLRLRQAHMLARDTGIPVALEFARRHPDLLGQTVLLNPHTPKMLDEPRDNFISGVQRHLLRNPDLVVTFAEFLRRQATTQLLDRILDRAFCQVPIDAEALKDPAVRAFLIRDIQALCARSVWGFAAEHGAYANGWDAPRDIPVNGPWTLAISSELSGDFNQDWLCLPGLRRVSIQGAGFLPQFTHPAALAALFSPTD